MQLIVDIQDKSLANKIVKILEVFKNDGVKIQTTSDMSLIDTKEDEASKYDVEYENSLQYKLDRAEFREMKEKL